MLFRSLDAALVPRALEAISVPDRHMPFSPGRTTLIPVTALLLLLPHEARGLRVGTSPSSSRRCCDALARAESEQQPVRLWNSGVCPFAQRVWIALLELETPFTHQIIDLADKPSEFLRLSELASGSKDKSTVPLLETGTGEVVSESLDIVRLLGKDTRLLPKQGDDHIEPFITHWVDQVVPAYYDLLRAPNEQQAQARQYSLLQALSELENLLLTRQGVGTAEEPFPSGPFLCDDFSLAEVVAAPWAERMLLMLPHWRAFELTRLIQSVGLDRTDRKSVV